AVIPAQLMLRIAPDGRNWRNGWKGHRCAACFLALSLLLPVGHYLWFKLNWHSGQYQPGLPGWARLVEIARALQCAISLNFLSAGLVLTVVALVMARRAHTDNGSKTRTGPQEGEASWHVPRAALVAALVLLLAGTGVYLPMSGMSGRYTMPA